jgi:hypothetical protein
MMISLVVVVNDATCRIHAVGDAARDAIGNTDHNNVVR